MQLKTLFLTQSLILLGTPSFAATNCPDEQANQAAKTI